MLTIMPYSGQYYTDYFGNKSGEHSHQLNSYDSFFKALASTILEDANELYEQLLREQVNTIIADYASNGNSLILPTSPTNNQPIDISKDS
jgi:hypothetical protein